MKLPGRERPPREVAAAVTSRERVLAWAPYDGGHLVATVDGLWDVPAPPAPASRLPWDEVDRAEWHDGHLSMQVTRPDDDPRVMGFEVLAPGRLPEVIKDRVNASIVVNDWHRLTTGGGVRVLGRRRHGDERLRWLLAFDRPTDATDPEKRAEAATHLRLARESVGEQPD